MFATHYLTLWPVPAQGWKLHVSAIPRSAPDVLTRALPVLLSAGVRFKVARNTEVLRALNTGEFGLSQVGKFITVYPANDDQAVALALALHDATSGLRGPRVPSDRPLQPESLVHYRYGSIAGPDLTAGPSWWPSPEYDLLDHAGRLTTDVRYTWYDAPPGVTDPFEAAGAAVRPPRRRRLLGDRFLAVSSLGVSYRGGVFRALDTGTPPPEECVLKQFWPDVGDEADGSDALTWGRHEADLLARHAASGLTPQLRGMFEEDGALYIALELVEGETLGGELNDEAPLPLANAIRLGTETADVLAALHREGVVHRDFTPENAVRNRDGVLRLIDFGIAAELSAEVPTHGAGTPPFAPPEQREPLRLAAVTEDVHAWAATLYLACGGRSAGDQVDPRSGAFVNPLPELSELRPGFPASLSAAVARGLSANPADRFPTMSAAREAWADAAAELRTGVATPVRAERSAAMATGTSGSRDIADLDPLALAVGVGDALLEDAVEVDGGLCWATRERRMSELNGPDLYQGAAGVGLFLAALGRHVGCDRFTDAARRTAAWVCGDVWGRGRVRIGLHCGESGIGLFLLRLAELLDEPAWLVAAELRARRIVDVVESVPELLYGRAGRGVFLCSLARATGDRLWTEYATADGESLLESMQSSDEVGVYWDVALGPGSERAEAYLGLSHGVAGIGLALARIGSLTGDERFLAGARAAGKTLLRTAVEDGDGLTWPYTPGDRRRGNQTWCHGAGGIGTFLLELADVTGDSGFRAASARARQTVAKEAERRSTSGLCHGLSGDLGFFLDRYRHSGAREDRDSAEECARRLMAFQDGGRFRMAADAPSSPDLFVGYAGVGAALLRLANGVQGADLVLGREAQAFDPAHLPVELPAKH